MLSWIAYFYVKKKGLKSISCQPNPNPTYTYQTITPLGPRLKRERERVWVLIYKVK